MGQLGGEQVIELTRPDRSAFPDGQMLVDLTTGRDPSWSSDGRTLVYACPAPGNVGGFPAVCSVAMADPELTRTVVLREGDRPRLSPDGSRIVVHRGMIDVGETWIAAADGSGARLLTDGALLDWSPDGAWLLGQPESATAQVAVVRPDGTGYRVLASGRDATWAPDSTRIGFVAVADGGSSLQVIDAASGSTEVLFRPDAGMTIASPEWLEDGRIVFAMDGDLWRLDPGAGAPVRLTARLEIAGALSASPDGAWIAFATDRLDGATTPSTLAIASIEGGWVTLQGPVLSTPPEWQPVAVP